MENKLQNKKIEGIALGDHVCSIYKNKEEQFSTVVPFIKKGLDNHQKCAYIVDENSKEEVIAELDKRGIDSKKYIKTNQLLLLTKRETYLKDGFFDPDKMIVLLKKTEKSALEEGYSGLRVTGEMTWVLEGVSGSEKLIEYEAKLNDFFPDSKSTAICQYNENKFKPEILVEVIHTHPFLIIYGNLYENKFYYSPQLYIEDTRIELPAESYSLIRDDIIE
ncbi:MAG: MEDS domain-containing protein [Parcubacteria group bacterium]|nr:MEDS domain-containing protein [Parcubacteria group bacterium]